MTTESENPGVPNTAKQAILSWLNKIVIGVILAVAGVAIGVLWQRYDARIRNLSYLVNTSDAIIPTDKVEGSGVDITIDGNPVSNLSTVSIAIYNTTNRDFENIPLAIQLTFDGSERVTILKETGGADATNINRINQGIPDGEMVAEFQEALQRLKTSQQSHLERMRIEKRSVKDIELTESVFKTDLADLALNRTVQRAQTRQGMYEAEYNIAVANRSNDPIFYVEYVFATEAAPKVDLAIVKKGVMLKQVSIADINTTPISQYVILGIVIIGLLLTDKFISVLSERKKAKRDEDLPNALAEALAANYKAAEDLINQTRNLRNQASHPNSEK